MNRLLETLSKHKPSRSKVAVGGAAVALLAMLAVEPALAQNEDICSSPLVTDVLNPLLITVFQIGPIVGAFSGIVSLVMMSQSTSKDKKKKWKERRNDAFLYGVVGVMVSGYVINFLADTVLGLDEGCLDTTLIGGSGNHLLAHVDFGLLFAVLPF